MGDDEGMTGARRTNRPLVVVAPSGNGTEPDAPDAAALRRHRGAPIEVVTTEDLARVERDLERSVSTLVAHGPDLVVRRALAAAVGTAVAFGVLRSSVDGPLGVALAGPAVADPADPAGLHDALDRVVGAPLRRVDVGVIEDRPFLTVLAIGAPELVVSTSETDDGIVGWWRRTVRLARRTGRVTVHVDGVQRWRGRTPVVLVANGPRLVRDGAARELGPTIDPTDGELDVAVLAPRRPDRWLAMWARLLVGLPQDPADLRWFRGSWIHARSEVPRPYEVDGERQRPTNVVDARVWPAALLLCDTATPVDEPVVDEPVADGSDRRVDDAHGDESVHDPESRST